MKVKSKMSEYIKKEDALRIFSYLEPPKFELDCWGRFERSSEYDMWKTCYDELQKLPCIKISEKDNANNC